MASSATPSTMPGNTSGRVASWSTSFAPGQRRTISQPASTVSTMATVAAMAAAATVLKASSR